jgi:hypothetical protein
VIVAFGSVADARLSQVAASAGTPQTASATNKLSILLRALNFASISLPSLGVQLANFDIIKHNPKRRATWALRIRQRRFLLETGVTKKDGDGISNAISKKNSHRTSNTISRMH